jgi:hypothetical protein
MSPKTITHTNKGGKEGGRKKRRKRKGKKRLAILARLIASLDSIAAGTDFIKFK